MELEETPEDRAEWMNNHQTDVDDWLGWGFLAFWAIGLTIILWPGLDTFAWFMAATTPVVAFYWWAFRWAKRNPSGRRYRRRRR